MWNRKKEDIDLHQKKRYQFIREQVRPQRKIWVFIWLKRLALLVIAACIFGGIAGGIIVLIHNHFIESERQVVEISTFTPMPEETMAPVDTKSKKTAEKEMTLSDINKLSQRLSAVGTSMDSAMVGIESKVSTENWLEKSQNAQSVSFGLIFREGEKYYDILTTCNTIQEQSSVNVQLMDDTMIDGSILGSDVQLNVAVVRIKKADIKKSLLEQMTVAHLGNGLGLVDGTSVIAIGCPNGVLHSIVTGVITNDSIQASIMDGEVQLYCTSIPFSERGNGVVLDEDGRVVGIITTEFTEETGTTGMAFIRISNVTTLISLLQKKITVPYIGIEGKSLSATTAKAHNLEVGAYVTEVYSGAPAYDGGMRVADVITKIDGENVNGMSDVYNSLLRHKTGDMVVYTVSRKSGNKKVTKQIKVKLG